jgi:hypothetical protein
MKISLLILAACTLLPVTWAAPDDSLMLSASQATFITKDDESAVHGQKASIELVNQWANNARLGLIKWNLASIPPGASVSSAKIILSKAYCSEGENHHTVVVDQVLGPWDEKTVSHDDKPALAEVTIATLLLVAKDFAAPEGTAYSVSSPELTELVNDWVKGRAANHGVCLRATDTTDGKYFAFCSNDATDPDLTPKLILTLAKSGAGAKAR